MTRGEFQKMIQSDAKTEPPFVGDACLTQGDEVGVAVWLPVKQAQVLADAADEAEYLLGNAGEVFGLIWSGLAGGWLARNDSGLSAVLDLCGRALRGAAEKEGAEISRLALLLHCQIDRLAASKPEEA